MPALVAALTGLIKALTVGLVLKTLLRLGLGITTFVGVLAFVEYGRDQIMATYGELPADVLTLLSIARIDFALSIILSAIVFRATYGFGPRITFSKPT